MAWCRDFYTGNLDKRKVPHLCNPAEFKLLSKIDCCSVSLSRYQRCPRPTRTRKLTSVPNGDMCRTGTDVVFRGREDEERWVACAERGQT
jgi:hypothetical protein